MLPAIVLKIVSSGGEAGHGRTVPRSALGMAVHFPAQLIIANTYVSRIVASQSFV